MEVSTREYCSIFETTIKTDSVEIVESGAEESLAEDFITAAFEINRFNGKSDVDTLKELYNSFLSAGEQEEFLTFLKK